MANSLALCLHLRLPRNSRSIGTLEMSTASSKHSSTDCGMPSTDMTEAGSVLLHVQFGGVQFTLL